MPTADPGFTWQEAVAAFGIISVAAFLVTWVFTDLLKIRRTPYIPILLLVALGLLAGYLAWSGTSGSDLLSSNAAWGLAAGLIATAVTIPLLRRLPEHAHATGTRLAGLMVWEGVLYGIAEGVLLAVLPVLAIWQACVDLGWADGTWASLGSGVLAIVGSLVVILVHHLGYSEFRSKAGQVGLFGALVVCGLEAIAFLVTGNVLAPVVAHIVLHGLLLLRGEELPPAIRAEPRAFSTQLKVVLPLNAALRSDGGNSPTDVGGLLGGQGRCVVVLEQSVSVGGCASSFEQDRYTFDVGASIFEVVEPLRLVFAALGTTIEDELDR